MGSIFGLSRITFAWLGEKENESDTAIQFLSDLGSFRTAQKQDAISFLQDEASAPTLTALRYLFSRSWWTRAWTLQEYIVPEPFVFVCGSSAIGRLSFERAMSWLTTQAAYTWPHLQLESLTGFTVTWKRSRIRSLRYDSRNLPLCDALVYAGGSAATKSRDCVYSLLGIVSDHAALNIKPKYDEDEDEVSIFEDLVRSQIRHTNCIDIICFANASAGKVKCPSWVPYWPHHRSTANDRMTWQSFPTLSHISSGDKSNEKHEQECASFSAAGGLPYEIRPGAYEPGTLPCKGVLLGTIAEVGASFSDVVKIQSRLPETATTQAARPQSLSQVERTHELRQTYEAPENLWKTIVLDRKDSRLHTRAPKDYESQFKWLCKQAITDPSSLRPEVILWFLHNALVIFKHHPHKLMLRDRLSSALASLTHHWQPSRDLPFTQQMLDVWINMNKVLAILDDGKLAMAPNGAKVGDKVFVLAGCNFPVGLREAEENGPYCVVGECYVDGFMHGEAISQDGGVARPWQTLNLS
ncbi:hypothetical protein F5Y13DRAFT_201571 [Hypoxylon sp. FL1857]|nr:hypothetical protein F5Y13DRAFT_201571 [Hypoxylon sp. FL1857]